MEEEKTESAEKPEEKKKEEVPEIYYVSLNSRMFASFIDSLAIMAVFYVFSPILFYLYQVIYSISGSHPDIAGFVEARHGIVSFQHLLQLMHEYGVLKRNVVDALALYVIAGFMAVPLWVKWQATPGKILIRAKIVDAKTLEKPSNYQFMVRYCAYLASILPAFLGFLYAGIDRRKQAFHDKIAGTVVIHTRKPWSKSFLPKADFKKVWGMYREMWGEVKKKK